jgi:hypothetical protein
MVKFLKITNATAVQGQLIGLTGIKTITTPTATDTTVLVKYTDGTTTTVTTAAQEASDVCLAIIKATEVALATSWQKPYFEMVLPKAVTSIVNA